MTGSSNSERVELPRDVDVLGISRAAAGDDRDVVEPVGPATGLADADLDFHAQPPEKASQATPSPATRRALAGTGSGENREETREDARGRAPHRLVRRARRSASSRASPQNCQSSDAVAPRGSSSSESATSKTRSTSRASGTSTRTGSIDPDEGRHHELPDRGADARRARAITSTAARGRPISSSASRSAASRGERVDRGVDLPAGERDLALVRRHGLGPLGEHEARLAVDSVAPNSGTSTAAAMLSDGGGGNGSGSGSVGAARPDLGQRDRAASSRKPRPRSGASRLEFGWPRDDLTAPPAAPAGVVTTSSSRWRSWRARRGSTARGGPRRRR